MQCNGASLDVVQQLLGQSELDHVLPYLEVDKDKFRQMFAEMLLWYTMCIGIFMEQQTQQQLLATLKLALGDVTWEAVAEVTGIKQRALKSYRLPSDSNGYRGMDKFVRDAVERALKEAQKTATKLT